MLWHRVARDLGRSVAEAKATLSAAEWVDWVAFYHLEAEAQAPRNP